MNTSSNPRPRNGARMKDSTVIQVTRTQSVLHLQFSRPQKRNALNQATWEAIPRVIDEVENDDSLSALVVSGAGEHFCAGADISELGTVRADPESAARYHQMAEESMVRLAHCNKPTIAAIAGYCIGGGLEVALACDLRIMSQEARLGITASKLGVVYGAASTRRLVDVVGPAAARFILYTADLIGAEKALQIGLATEVVPTGSALEVASKLAEKLAGRSPYSIRGAKTIIDHYLMNRVMADDVDIESLDRAAINSAFYKEAVKAFNSR